MLFGYVVCEVTAKVYTWDSAYKSKAATLKNVERCLYEYLGGAVWVDKAAYGTNEERVYETAELFCTDNYTDDMRPYELGGHFTVSPTKQDPIREIAGAYGKSAEFVSSMLNAWMIEHEYTEPDYIEFSEFMKAFA